jgi:hypothetical protein
MVYDTLYCSPVQGKRSVRLHAYSKQQLGMRLAEEETLMWCSTVGVIVTLTLSLLVAPLCSDAQQPGKVYRIGFLSALFPPSESDWQQRSPFLQGLRELGWIEGQNMVIERRWAEMRFERLPALATELVQLKVDLIVAAASLEPV